jgi:hypothetical protein
VNGEAEKIAAFRCFSQNGVYADSEGVILRSIFSLSVRGRDGATAPPAWLVRELWGKAFTCVITFSPRLSNWCAVASQNQFYFYFYFCFLLQFNLLAITSVFAICSLARVLSSTRRATNIS